jgi:serine/threonine protein kinase
MFGPYTPVRRIGTGGMGEVWAATDPDGNEVAVKVLPEGSLVDEAARARFAREVEAAQRVQHPRVQAVIAADANGEQPWLAMELVEGPTLAQHVVADGPVAGRDLHLLATGLAEALIAVHAVGVVHRDVSPANVVLGADGPVLVDFGIARFAEATTLTLTGTVVGTAGWLAPELLRDDEATAAADVWSWGAVLAYAATGRPPADGSRAEVVLRKVLDCDLDLRGLPPWLDRVVRRCLVPDPASRPSSPELIAELDPSTAVVTPTAVLPDAEAAPAPAPTVEPIAETREVPWQPWALRAAVLAAGAVVGLVAPPLAVVLVIAVLVLAAIALKIWLEERAEERKVAVGPATLVLAAGLAGVTALAVVVGLLAALLLLVALIVLFFVLGGDLG